MDPYEGQLALAEPDAAYIEQFRTQNAILRQIYDALTRQVPRAVHAVPFGPGKVRLRIETIVLVNTTAAALTLNLSIGTRAYPFAVPASTTIALPFPLVIESGLGVTLDVGAAYLIGDLERGEGAP